MISITPIAIMQANSDTPVKSREELEAENELLRKAIEASRSIGDRLAKGIPVSKDEIRAANELQQAALKENDDPA